MSDTLAATQGTFALAADVRAYGANAALMLAQLRWLTGEARHVQWVKRNGKEWIAYADHEWVTSVGLSTDQARRARKKLADEGVLAWATFKVDNVPKTHIRLRDFTESDSAKSPSGLLQIAESLDSAKSPNAPLYETEETTTRDMSGNGVRGSGLVSQEEGGRLDPPRAEVEELCSHLADRIEANGSKRPTVGKGWRDAARLMLDRDGRTVEQVHRAIDWCQDDEFWRGNILSMPKLREKYDQLRLQAQRKTRPKESRHDRISRELMERQQHRQQRRELTP